jgi:ferredoxin
VPKEVADTAFDAAACIGCGACVAACPNAAAMLFTALELIARLNRDVVRAAFGGRREPLVIHGAPLRPAPEDT